MRSPKQEGFGGKDKSRQETTGEGQRQATRGRVSHGQKQSPCSAAHSSSNRCLQSLPETAAARNSRCLLSRALGGRDQRLLGEGEQHDGGCRD